MRNTYSFTISATLPALAISACSIVPIQMYEGAPHERSKDAVISSVGFYPERKLSLIVVAINGKAVPTTRTSEFLVQPDSYRVTLQVKNDMQVHLPNVTWKEVTIDADLKAMAGHSYIPNADLTGTQAAVRFDDAGLNYPQHCLPLYRWVEASKAPAADADPSLCAIRNQ